MDDVKICNHENQLLLNAAKGKFSGSREAASFNPPKFNIPLLKVTGISAPNTDFVGTEVSLANDNHSTSATISTTNTPTQMSDLNQFILGQLLEKSAVHKGGFVLPELTAPGHNVSISTDYCMDNKLTKDVESCPIYSLSNRMDDLSVNDKSLPPKTNIDLTAALSSSQLVCNSKNATATRTIPKRNIEKEDFEIPFIACDLKENPVVLPRSTECCQSNISNYKLQHYLVEPSSFARITCLKFKRIGELPPIDHSFTAKHNIQPFRFDTKSPDDIVLANFGKYQR